jgi:hypothetical protein
MSAASERRDGFGLHPQIGRRYEHADLTTHRLRNRRSRRRTLLVERAVRSIMNEYARELEIQPAACEDFAREVARRLRAEVRPEWSPEEAERRARELAERLFDELGGDDAAGDGPAGAAD